MKVEVHINVLDSLCSQLEDRFPEKSLGMVRQMSYFTHEGILEIANKLEQETSLKSSEVEDLCSFYNIESELLVSEISTFARLYKVLHKDIDISDVLHKSENKSDQSDVENNSSSNEETDSDNEEDEKLQKNKRERMVDKWIKRGFIRPYRCIMHISGSPILSILYRILLSLAVTSCSAERMMSRLKIVKNRLRSSMSDTWLSNLLILASEKDILKAILNEEIINKFALTTPKRKQFLLR